MKRKVCGKRHGKNGTKMTKSKWGSRAKKSGYIFPISLASSISSSFIYPPPPSSSLLLFFIGACEKRKAAVLLWPRNWPTFEGWSTAPAQPKPRFHASLNAFLCLQLVTMQSATMSLQHSARRDRSLHCTAYWSTKPYTVARAETRWSRTHTHRLTTGLSNCSFSWGWLHWSARCCLQYYDLSVKAVYCKPWPKLPPQLGN